MAETFPPVQSFETAIPDFNPSKPFDIDAPPFDPSKPFETLPSADRKAQFDAIDPARGNQFALGPAEAFGPSQAPNAFLERVRRGEALKRILDKAVGGAVEGFGSEPGGLSPEHVRQLRDLGIFHDPHRGSPSLLGLLSEGVTDTTLSGLEMLMRGLEAGIHGAGGAFGQLVDELGGSGMKAEREAINFGNFAMIEAGMGRFTRLGPPPDQAPTATQRVLASQDIGGLPKPEDFRTGADVLRSPAAEQNLRDLWEERGIHPAEAVHDADSDTFLKADLTHPNPEPRDRSGVARVTGSPVAEGTPRTELAKTGEAHIDAVLDSEVTNRNIDNPAINDSYDVPYSAGGSTPLADPTVYIDRHFPRSMTIDGVTF